MEDSPLPGKEAKPCILTEPKPEFLSKRADDCQGQSIGLWIRNFEKSNEAGRKRACLKTMKLRATESIQSVLVLLT